jgi:stearoyl-CoA desaturase (Delta-9 desaturase)
MASHQSHTEAGAARGPRAPDLEPIENQTLDRALSTVATVLPLLGLGAAGWLVWGELLHWPDLVILAVTYIPIGLGVTVGFHRYFTHRSFKTSRAVRAILGALGSAALEGPVIAWAATHRRHHACSDKAGDPHSPHVDPDGESSGPLAGLVHAHLGWVFMNSRRAAPARYAPDLMRDPVTRAIDRTMLLWVAIGLAIPFGLGVALTGTLFGGLTGFIWGGLVRIFVLHHVTYAINSLCHFFGRQPFRTGDESRNLAWLAPFTLGEAWHNNHHAFPTSASHGLRWWEVDPSGLVIRAMERLGLIWDVRRVAPARLQAKAL